MQSTTASIVDLKEIDCIGVVLAVRVGWGIDRMWRFLLNQIRREEREEYAVIMVG